MPLNATVNPAIARNRAHPASVDGYAERIRAAKSDISAEVAHAFERVQANLNDIRNTIQQAQQSIDDLWVEDSDGLLVGRVGDWWEDGEQFRGGHFIELYVGDSVGARFASDAPFYATASGEVVIGKGGCVNVRDPYNGMAAWIGAQFDTLVVTGAVSHGGLVQLTVVGHPLETGDVVLVADVGGVPDSRGEWTVTKIGADTFDLDGSTFVGTYTSGGTVTRVLHITGAADNGSGLIQLTVTAHGYESGDRVNVVGVGGVSNATGQWTIDVIGANTFDLVGSTWAGGYTSGGTCIRFFGGMLAQTFAIGPDFANYKLRAFADGSLKIKDALITLDGSAALIQLDPDEGKITLTGKNAYNVIIEMSSMEDPVSHAPAGFLVKDATFPLDNFTAIGYDHLGVYDNGVQKSLLNVGTLRLYDAVGTQTVGFLGGTGNGEIEGNFTCYALIIGGTTVISHAKNGLLNSLNLVVDLAIGDGGTGASTASGARSNLDVYSKGEVDTLLAGKSSSTHTHTVSDHNHSDPQGGSTGDGGSGSTSGPV